MDRLRNAGTAAAFGDLSSSPILAASSIPSREANVLSGWPPLATTAVDGLICCCATGGLLLARFPADSNRMFLKGDMRPDMRDMRPGCKKSGSEGECTCIVATGGSELRDLGTDVSMVGRLGFRRNLEILSMRLGQATGRRCRQGRS